MFTTVTPASDPDLPKDSFFAISIRNATAGDAVPMWHVHTQAIRQTCGEVYTPAQIEAWISDDTPDRYRHDLATGRSMFVAEYEDQIIGFSSLFESELEALYVNPRHAHRRAGRLLLRAVEQHALEQYVDCLYLDGALNALSFYKSCGYDVIGRSNPAFDTGVKLPCVRMRKRLHSAAATPVRSRLSGRLLTGSYSAGTISMQLKFVTSDRPLASVTVNR